MDFRIVDVQKKLVGGLVRPVRATLELVEEYDDEYGHGKMFQLQVSSEGVAYVRNSRVRRKTKTGVWGGSDFLELLPGDVEDLTLVLEHWQRIRGQFLDIVSHGSSPVGYQGSTYVFPEGTEVMYRKDDARPQRVEGPSINSVFPSRGCSYVSGYPVEQKYSVGRFEVYLEKSRWALEDGKTVQVLEDDQPGQVLTLLAFVAVDPSAALERLLG